MALGELWWLDDLAADCADDGVYEGLLVSSPTHAPGGISAAPNAVVPEVVRRRTLDALRCDDAHFLNITTVRQFKSELPPQAPKERTVETVDLYDVVVVGFGPAGEVAASTLGIAGHRVAVFERQRELYPLPRMVTFDGEACRTVQATGKNIDEALSTAVVLDSCSFGDADADPLLVLDWKGVQGGFRGALLDLPARRREDPARQGRRRCRTSRSTSASRSSASTSTRTTSRCRCGPRAHATTPRSRTVHAKYVIGADGTNSFDPQGRRHRDAGLRHPRALAELRHERARSRCPMSSTSSS